MTQLAGRTPQTTDHGSRSAGVEHGSSGQGRPQRGIDRSLLPNGRAVVGGFLIAASGVGLFAAYEHAHSAPVTKFVVATRPLPPGEVIR